MKKTLSIILSLLMIISVLGLVPFSASALPSMGTLGTEGTTYYFESGTLEVNGKGTTMHNYTNTGEDVSPFKNSTEIKKAIFMNTPNIGNCLFIGCSNLTTVEIVNYTTTIGDNAFCDCTSLETVDFHNKDVLTTVNEEAFRGCTGLKEFKFPKTLTKLGNYAFAGCSNLERVVIPNPNCYIGGNAFINCAKLKGFTYPEITSPMKAIYDGVFYGCSAMKKVSLPGNIEYVDTYAFGGCTALTDVYFEGTQEKWNAIYWQPNNDAAKNATLHCNCEWGYCGDNAEYVYNNVDKTLTISGTGKTDNYNDDLGAGAPWYSYKDDIESVVIKEGITGIGHYNFADESNLKSITVPKSLEGFGKGAFINCNALTDVYYTGTESEWNSAGYHSNGNGALDTATKHYSYCNHNYSSSVTQPTCTEKGYTTYTCSICGDSYVDDNSYTNALGHDFSSNAEYCRNNCGAKNPNYVAPQNPSDNTGDGGNTENTNSQQGGSQSSSASDNQSAAPAASDSAASTAAAAKKANTVTVKAKTVTLKAKDIKKKNKTFAQKKAFTVSKAKGKVTYKKSSGNKKITVSSAGKITVKKGLKKGTYKIKVKVTAAGNATYKAKSKTVTVTVKIK